MNTPTMTEPSKELDRTDIAIILSDYSPNWNGNMCDELLELFKRKLNSQLLSLIKRIEDEVLGADTATLRNGLVGETHKDTAQNELRATQRTKLRKIVKELGKES